MDVLYIKISDEFNIDLCVTFLNFQTSSRSSCLVNTITLQELPVSFCNFTEVFSTSKSQIISMLTFVWPFWPFKLGHFQMAASWAGGIRNPVTAITLHKLPVSSCNFIVVFSTSKSLKSLMLTFVWPLWTFKLAQG